MFENTTVINREKALKFFRALAAGAPLTNCTWGKTKREILDYYHFAVAGLEKEINEGSSKT